MADEFVQGQISIAGNTDSVCFGDIPVIFDATGFTGGRLPYTHLWEYANNSQSFTVIGMNSSSFQETNNLFENTNYRVSVVSSLGCGTRISDSILIRVNELPANDSTIIQGPTSICENSKGHYYRLVPENTDSIYWSLTKGKIVSKMSDRVFVDYDSIPLVALDTLVALITNRRTQCQREVRLPVAFNTGMSQMTTSIVWKHPSDILICADSTSGMNYIWGYFTRSTGVRHVVQSSNLRYCQYPSAIDTVTYLYFVTTVVQGCRTTSFYELNNNSLESKLELNQPFEIFPNPTTGRVFISGPTSRLKQMILTSMDGRTWDLTSSLEQSFNGWSFDLSLPAGVYHVHILTERTVFKSNLIVTN